MTAWRQAIELSIGDEDVARLVTITRSRTEPASCVERARMLLAYREDPSFFAVPHALGVHHRDARQQLVLAEPRPNAASARGTAEVRGLAPQARRPGSPHPEETKA